MSGLIKRIRLSFKRVYTYTVIGAGSFALSASIFANPVVDNIAHGNISVQQTQSTTTVNQVSQQGIINWKSFNIDAGEHTHFNQPANGVTLNRISPTQGASEIYGRLSATGKIILVNPAGVFIGPNAFINVGGLIASTAGITNENFLKGYYKFDQASTFNGSVVNKGTIIAAEHGLVALMGNAVSNEGYIQANIGSVALASGNAFTMSFAGNDLISFVVDQSTLQRGVDANGTVLADGVKNTGRIVADGGQVLLHAKAAAGVLDNAINMEGFVEAQSVYEKKGTIVLSADPQIESVVRVAGSLKSGEITVMGHNILVEGNSIFDASSNLNGGKINIGGPTTDSLPTANALVLRDGAQLLAHGGFVETSAKQLLDVGEIEIRAGEWLLDPYDLTIGSGSNSLVTGSSSFEPTSGAGFLSTTTLYAALESGSVTILTGVGASGNGDIFITSPLTYSSANSLTLSAYRHIASSLTGAVITNSGSGEVVLRADNTGTGIGTIQFTGNGATVTTSGGARVYYNPVTFGIQETLFANGTSTTTTQYMLVHSLGLANDETDFPSLGALSNAFNASLWTAGKNYALSKDIDASATSAWNSGNGFRPIGNYNFTSNAGVPFAGKFDGQGYTISNLTIRQPDLETIGMFGRLGSAASVSNLSLNNIRINYDSTNANNNTVNATRYIGSVAAYMDSGASINKVHVNGEIDYLGEAANLYAGGITAYMAGGNISLVESNVHIDTNTNNSITASTFTIGGVVGSIAGGTVRSVSSLGNINATGNVTTRVLGGLAGSNAGTVTDSFSIGAVLGAGTKGGLIGSGAGAVNTSYWNTETSGIGVSAGGTPYNTTQLQNSANLAGFDLINEWNIVNGATYPYHRFIYSSGPRVISGSLSESVNTNSALNMAINGNVITSTRSYANGAFYFQLKEGVIADSSNLLLYLNNANTVANLIAIAPTSNNSLTNLTITANTLTLAGSTPLTNALIAAAQGSNDDTDIIYSVSSGNLTLDENKDLATVTTSTYTPGGNVITSGTGALNVAGNLQITSPTTLTSNSNSSISGNMSGSSSFTLNGSGILSLSGNNTAFTGSTSLSSGTLSLASTNALSNTSGITISNNAILRAIVHLNLGAGISVGSGGATLESTNGANFEISGNTSGANNLNITGNSHVTISGDINTASVTSDVASLTIDNSNVTTISTQTYGGTITLAGGFVIDATDAIIEGDVSGTGSITKDGTGTLTLAGSNSYSGGTTINNGNTVAITNNQSLGSTSSSLTLNNATLQSGESISIDNDINLGTGGGILNITDGVLTVDGSISGNALTKSGAGTLELSIANTHSSTSLTNGTLIISHNTALGSNPMTFSAGSTGILNISNNTNVGNSILLTGNGIITGSGSSATLSGSISGAGNLAYESGTLLVSGTNTVTGSVSVNDGAEITLTSVNALGNGTTNPSGITINTGANVILDNLSFALRAPLTLAGGTLTGLNSTVTNSNAITLSGSGTLSSPSTFTISTPITGSGNLIVNGGGTITMNNQTNDFTGSVSVTNSTLQTQYVSTLGDGSILGLNNSTIFYTGLAETLSKALQLADDTSNTIHLANGNLTLGANSASLTTTTGSLIKTGDAALIINSPVVYSGTTTIHGDIELGIDGALNTSSDIIIHDGTLQTNAPMTITSNIIVPDTKSVLIDSVGGDLTISGIMDGPGTINLLTSGGTIALSDVGTELANYPLNFIANGSYATLLGGTLNIENAVTFNSPVDLHGDSTVSTEINDITFNAVINGAHSLTFSPARDLILNANAHVGLDVQPGHLVIDVGRDAIVNSDIYATNFTMQNGNWFQQTQGLDVKRFFISNDFSIDGGSFMRVRFGSPSSLQLIDVYGLQGIGSNASYLGASISLINDIDGSVTVNWRDGKGFKPIGDATSPFIGTIISSSDLAIKNITINETGQNIGLFGQVGAGTPGPVLDGLVVLNMNIIVTGDGSSNVGGMIGFLNGGFITRSYVTGQITTSGEVTNIGGFTGKQVTPSSLSKSHATVDIVATNDTPYDINVGGLSGSNDSFIFWSYASGSIYTSGGRYVGGLVGRNTRDYGIDDSYSLTHVTNALLTGDASTGGLVGATSGTIFNTYSSGSVNVSASVTNAGGWAGVVSSGSPYNNYYDPLTSKIPDSYATALTAENRLTQAAYSGFDFNPVTALDNRWFNIEGYTRPILGSEFTSSVRNAHQLQLISAPILGNGFFGILNDIDLHAGMTDESEVWATNRLTGTGVGFAPAILESTFDAFGSTFNKKTDIDGLNHVIRNLYIDSTENYAGFFSQIEAGTLTSTVSNLGFIDADVSSTGDYVGVIAGASSGILDNVFATGKVNGTNNVGGLVGSLTGTASATASISNSYSQVDVDSATGTNIGGIAGITTYGTIHDSYASGRISTGASYAGGITGYLNSTGTIHDSYFTGSAVGASYIGGIAGRSNGVIDDTYVSGQIFGVTNTGAIVGYRGAGTVGTSYYDMVTTGQINGFGGNINSGTTGFTNVKGGCFGASGTACPDVAGSKSTNAGGAIDLSQYGSYTGFDITNAPTATGQPAYTWFIFDGYTRPILLSEWSTTVTNAHQLQLMGTALSDDYVLGTDLSLTQSFENSADIWATDKRSGIGYGFVPIGIASTASDSTTGAYFIGTFDGQQNIIDDLYINNTIINTGATSDSAGLFGTINATANISNLSITNANITGRSAVGILAGNVVGDSGDSIISNVFTSGIIKSNDSSGYRGMGGLIGVVSNKGTNNIRIENSYSIAEVINIGDQYAAGLIGQTQTSDSATIHIYNTYSTGRVTGVSANNAGFISAISSGTTVEDSFWDTLTSNRTNGYSTSTGTIDNLIGGCFGRAGDCSIQPDSRSSNEGAAVDLSLLSTYRNIGWNALEITSIVSTNAQPFTASWFIFDGQSRPILVSEWNTRINSPHRLQLMGAVLAADYTLTGNIFMGPALENASDIWGDVTANNASAGFIPIGASEIGATNTAFTGTISGVNNFFIKELYIFQPNTTKTVGLFGSVSASSFIKNLSLIDANITGTDVTGGLIGEITGPGYKTIDNIYVNGRINAKRQGAVHGIGSLIGYASADGLTIVKNSYSTASVTSSNNIDTGGFIGVMDSSLFTITSTYATGAINAADATNVGGFIGRFANGTITKSLWDTDTTEQAKGYGLRTSGVNDGLYGGCFGNSCQLSPTNSTNTVALDLSTLSAYTTAGWTTSTGSGVDGNITTTPSTTLFKPKFSWFKFETNGNTRPMLVSEWSNNVYTSHQLQLMGIALRASYELERNINLDTEGMNNLSEIWASQSSANRGSGFVPVGYNGNHFSQDEYAYRGKFNGQNYTINGLYIYATASNVTDFGLFGSVRASSVLQNVNLFNANINFDYQGTLANSNFTRIGVLAGNSLGVNIINVHTSGEINASGDYDIVRAGGVGGDLDTSSIMRNSSANVNLYISGGEGSSGFTAVGGLVGAMFNTSEIHNSYATGDIIITGTSDFRRAGGLVGNMGTGGSTVFYSYSTGRNVSSSGAQGGLIGNLVNESNNLVVKSFWDVESSGVTTAVGTCASSASTCTSNSTFANMISNNITGMSTDALMSLSTFTNAGWDIDSTPNTTNSASKTTWFIFEGATRPVLASQWNPFITTPEQLQLVAMRPKASYVMLDDIDMTKAMHNPSRIWGTNQLISTGGGFLPIGTESNPFTGSFDGDGYSIINLFINSDQPNIGLFGVTQAPANIANLGLINIEYGHQSGDPAPSIVNMGAFIAKDVSGTILRNVFASGQLSVYGGFTDGYIGGIVGQTNGIYENIYSGIDIVATRNDTNATGSLNVGGFAGINTGSIINSYSTGRLIINGDAATINIGGFVGENSGIIQHSYSSGSVISIPGNVGGFIGNDASGTVISSFWDTDSSRYDTSAGVIGEGSLTGITTSDMLDIATFADAGWSITSTPNLSVAKPTTDWFIFDGDTRPMLMSEWTKNIRTSHQLQLIGTTLGADYQLTFTVEMYDAMRNPADVWVTHQSRNVGSGFVPIGSLTNPFVGSIDGNQYAVKDLYINRDNSPVGLFGYTDIPARIADLGVLNATIIYRNTNESTADVKAGLIAASTGTGSLLQGNYAIGDITIDGDYGSAFIGGMVGDNNATIRDSYAFANITVNGNANTTDIYAGGLVGNNSTGANTLNSYSLGNVIITGSTAGDKFIGGFVGKNESNIINAYSSGLVSNTGSSASIGGFAGANSGTVTNSFWDTETSGQLTSAGSNNTDGYRGMSKADMMTLTNFSTDSNFISGTPWSITSTPSDFGSSPVTTWFLFEGNTRPMLLSEWSLNITTPHQLQLMGVALKGTYELTTDIDLSKSANHDGEVWNTETGFVPVGTASNPFTGNFDGVYNTIHNLYINRSGESNVGLFGSVQPLTSKIMANVTLANVDITGGQSTGGLVGNLLHGKLYNIAVTGTVTGSTYVGGIAGQVDASVGDILYAGSHVVSSSNFTGGMFGYIVDSFIDNAYATGSVTSGGNYAGGIAGDATTTQIRYSYSSASVDGVANTAGFIGVNNSSTLADNFYDAYTSQHGIAVSLGSATGVQAGCLGGSGSNTCPTTNGASGVVDLGKKNTYTNWSINNVASDLPIKPSGMWFIFEDQTRPMLIAEWNRKVTTPHQLQLAGSTLAADYILANNIDLSTSFDGDTSTSDVWGTNKTSGIGAGFVPIGTLSTPFTGDFNGRDKVINGLYINSSNSIEVGLFGSIQQPAVIENIRLTNADINYDSTSTVNTYIGPLAGFVYDGTTLINIIVDHSSINVTSNNASANITVGGIAGTLHGRLLDSFSDTPIHVTATSMATLYAGGLSGFSGSSAVIEESYTNGFISLTGTPTTTSLLGGISGSFDGTLRNVYSTRDIAGTGTIGGLVAAGAGTAENSYWDAGATGIDTSVIGTSKNTYDLFDADTFENWDFVNTWNIVDGRSFPFLRQIYPDPPLFISGSSSAAVNETVRLYANGTEVDSVATRANGFYYFTLPTNRFIGGESLLLLIDNGSIKSNAVAIALADNESLSGETYGLHLNTNTVTLGSAGISSLNHTDIANAINGVGDIDSNSNILFSLSGSNLIIGNTSNNFHLVTGSGTTYNPTGNLTLAGSGTTTATFNGNVSFETAGVTLSSQGTSSFIFNKPVNVTANTNININSIFNNNATLNITNSTLAFGNQITLSGAMNADGSLININGSGNHSLFSTTLTNGTTLTIAGSATFTGPIDLDNSNLTLSDSNDSTFGAAILANSSLLTAAGNISFSGLLSIDNSDIDINGIGNSSFAITTIANNGSIDAAGNSTFSSTLGITSGASAILAGTSNFTNTTTINNGSLTLGSEAIFSALNIENNATINTISPMTINGALLISASSVTASNTFDINNTLTLISGASLALESTGEKIFSAATNLSESSLSIAGDAHFLNTLDAITASTLDIVGDAQFDGATTINASELSIIGNSTFSNTVNVDSGTLILSGNNTFDSSLELINAASANLNGINKVNAFNASVTLTGTDTTMSVAGSRNFGDELNVNASATLHLLNTSPTEFDNLVTLNDGALYVSGNATFNQLLNLSSGAHITIDGTAAITHLLTLTDSTMLLNSDVTMSIPLNALNATITLNGISQFNNTVTLNNTTLSANSDINFNAPLNLTGATTRLNGTNALTNSYNFNNPVTITAQNLILSADGSLTNAFTFHDTVNNSASISLQGNNNGVKSLIFNGLLTLTNATIVSIPANGVKIFDVNAGIAGGQNLSFAGSGSGSYQYLLEGPMALNNLYVSGANNVKNNILDISTSAPLVWNITNRDSGTMTGMSGIATATFANIDNITGGSGGNLFVFSNNGRISGTLNGRERLSDAIINRLDFSRMNASMHVVFSDTSRLSAGVVSNRILGDITRFRAINDIIHNPGISNGKITLTNVLNQIVITAANTGYINNPIQFKNFQRVQSISGIDQVIFEAFSLINPATGTSIMPSATMFFEGFNTESFQGNITKTDAVADAVNATQIRYVNDEGVDMLTDVARGNLEKLVKEQSEIVDQILDETKVGTGAACGA